MLLGRADRQDHQRVRSAASRFLARDLVHQESSSRGVEESSSWFVLLDSLTTRLLESLNTLRHVYSKQIEKERSHDVEQKILLDSSTPETRFRFPATPETPGCAGRSPWGYPFRAG